jgi:uncharacterized protein YqeY
MIKQQIDQDLKTAMLAGDKPLVSTLRGLKSAILYVEVAESKRDEGLTDEAIISLLQKESKKRQEAADMYSQGGNEERQAAELYEKEVISKYLPASLSDTDISILIDAVIEEQGPVTGQTMGQVIGAVKARSAGAADGAVIARLVKERLSLKD